MPNPVPGAFSGGIPHDVVADGPGFVAVGRVTPCCTGGSADSDLWQSVVWTSVDGSAWKLVPDLEGFGRSGLLAVASDDQGTMVAIGYDILPRPQPEPPGSFPPLMPGTVWRSENGVDWIAVQGVEGIFRDIAWTGTEWIIAGESEGSAALFVSTDLATWSTETLHRNGTADLLAVGEDGRVLAVGCIGDPPIPPCDAAVWVGDGDAWQAADLDSGPPTAAAAGSGLFVVAAAGTMDNPRDRTWVSSDGLRWEPGTVLTESSARIATLGITEDGLIAGGSAVIDQTQQPRLWQSGDGLTWTRFAEPARADGQVSGSVRELLVTADRIIAVGDVFAGGAGPYVWIGER